MCHNPSFLVVAHVFVLFVGGVLVFVVVDVVVVVVFVVVIVVVVVLVVFVPPLDHFEGEKQNCSSLDRMISAFKR